jgi:Carboxypeptidase regulatory-like domain
MKWRVFALLLCLCGSKGSKAQERPTLLPDAPRPQPGIIVGTVVDVNNDPVPGASVTLQSPVLTDPRAVVSNDNGFFEFKDLEPGSPYHVIISAEGFAGWTSDEVILKPGQYVILTVSKLRIATALTQVNVGYSPVEIASEQVKVEEQQRIFGFIPNFYVQYDPNAAPLTTKLKFQLAAKVAFDPVTLVGVGVFAAANQAGNTPNYRQGAIGYGERYGAAYANGFTDIMIGGAVLPSLLHQDPRYFYQGTGTNKSRALHALTSPFVCKGDNGRWQANYSTMGGDLAAAALTNIYYPPSNRGVGLFLSNFFIDTGQRAAANLAQEFILRRVTKAKNQK